MQKNDDPKRSWCESWNQIRTIYRYELRGALRERTIVLNSILLPIFLYPLIMWAAFTGMSFVHGQAERTSSRVLLLDLPKEHPGLRLRFERNKRIEILAESTLADESAIQSGKLDALVRFHPATNSAAKLAGNFRVEIIFNASKDRSAKARERIESAVSQYRRDWLAREARHHEISEAELTGFIITNKNIASERQMGGFILGMLLPVLFVVMVAAGCFYPAIDSTAGERERNTWETLMSSAANRVNIVTAKYLYVTTLGGLAGTLNLAAFALTVKPIFAPLLQQAGASFNFTIPLASLPLLGIAALLLAGFVAAGMMIFASFARTFKEGQAMIMPFYLLVLLPPMFLQQPNLRFTTELAFVPVINVTMLVRSAVTGVYPLVPICITIGMSVLMIALCIRFAAFVLRFEDVMIGGYNGSLKQFISERVLRRNRPATVLNERHP